MLGVGGSPRPWVEAKARAAVVSALTGPATGMGGRGRVEAKGDKGSTATFDAKTASVAADGAADGTFPPKDKPRFSSHSFGAHFVEVTWQPEIARLRVSRIVSAIDAGRILNPLAARNQIEGALVMGIGMALFEGTEYDPQNGAPMNASLADYVVPVNADVPALEVHFIEFPDLNLNALGARGVGEIGLAGTAAAITNAVYHATGIRVRELPLRIEDLL